MVKRGSQNKFGGLDSDTFQDQTNAQPTQWRRLDGENRVIELKPPKKEDKVAQIKETFKATLPSIFTGMSKEERKKATGTPDNLLGTSPFIGFGLNANPSGLVGSGKLALSLVPKTPMSLGGTILAGGALFASPKLRSGVAETPERLWELGKDIGEKVEDISNKDDAGGDSSYPSWLKNLLGFGLGAGITAGATGLLIDKFKDKKGDVQSLADKLPNAPPIPQSITSFQGGVPSIPTTQSGTPVVSGVGADTPVIKATEKGDKKEVSEGKPVTINNNIKITNTNQTKRHTKKYINTIHV